MATVPCLCPPTEAGGPRHPAGDTVALRQKLDFRSAVAMQKAVQLHVADDEEIRPAEILAVLSESYLLWGVESWTLVDRRDEAIPVTHEAIERILLGNIDAAMIVADEADDLYQSVVLRPLLERGSRSSPVTPTSASTSPETSPPPEPQKPSKRSSTTTTRTADTARTSRSPAGDSNSSPSWALAGSSDSPS